MMEGPGGDLTPTCGSATGATRGAAPYQPIECHKRTSGKRCGYEDVPTVTLLGDAGGPAATAAATTAAAAALSGLRGDAWARRQGASWERKYVEIICVSTLTHKVWKYTSGVCTSKNI